MSLDKLDQRPLPDVTVEVIDAPAAYKSRLATPRQGRPDASPDRLVTDDHGLFRWLDLPVGTYTLRASLSGTRYAIATTTASVVASTAASAKVLLVPTAVTGTVSADTPAGPLAMVRVRMLDSGEVTFSAADGSFTLSPLEPGAARVIEFTAQRYVTATQTVMLVRGKTTTGRALRRATTPRPSPCTIRGFSSATRPSSRSFSAGGSNGYRRESLRRPPNSYPGSILRFA